MLEARGRLDRRDDLASHAQLGERAERRLLVVSEVPHRFVEADQPLLDEILGVAAGQEVRAGLEADEAGIAADQLVEGLAVAVSCLDDELQILELPLNPVGWAGDGGWTGGCHFWGPCGVPCCTLTL